MTARIASITVAFNPDMPRLARQLVALEGQVDDVIVVDNGSRPVLDVSPAAVRIVALQDNEGIARGLNAGIEAARARGATHVLLLDHDSVPAPGMAAALLAASAGVPAASLAAVGPRVHDSRDAREYPFIRLGWLRNHHLRCAGEGAVVDCDFLITSGTLLSLSAFDAVGPFEEDLFIDSVDREWCFRARARGFSLKGVCAAHLDHRLGDHRRSFAGGIDLVVHSPERLYYMTRNRLLLYQRGYVPLKWKLKDFLRVLAKFTVTMIFVVPRGEYARMTLRAVRDALAGRGGKLGG